MRPASVLCLVLAAGAEASQPEEAPAIHPRVDYFEAEGFSGPWATAREPRGHFGPGCRLAQPGAAATTIDRTLFLFRSPKRGEGYRIWVRAWTDPEVDRRVAVELITQEGSTRLDPTHAAPHAQGWRWQCAGEVKPSGRGRRFCQLRLHSVQQSQPVVDAVVVTTDPAYVPSDRVRPDDDPRVTQGDGEGTSRMSPGTAVAGSRVELRARYTVGPSGVATGGALRFFIPQSWSAPQCRDPKGEGYTSCEADRPGVRLALTCYPIGRHARAFSGELRHYYECWARVVSGRLRRGDVVTVVYGDKSQGGPGGCVQTYIQSAADFRNEIRAWHSPMLPLGLCTDANGDREFRCLPADRSHAFAVGPGPAKGLHVVVPSIVRTGEAVRVRVAALDEHNNGATWDRAGLSMELVSLDHGRTIGPFAQGERIDRPGAYVVRTRAAGGRLVGTSNAMKCVADAPAYRLYWGDLHCHHRRCDGLRRFDEAAAHARDVAGLDVVALSPHACYITDRDLADLWAVDDRFDAPGRFVTIYAYEWAAGGKGAAHSVLYSEKPMPLCFRAFGGGNVIRGRPALWQALEQHRLDVVTVPHHVSGVADHHSRYQRAFEICSQWGAREAGVAANLDAGAKACFFGTSDNHTGQPGLQPLSNRWAPKHHPGALTAFLAKRLDRPALFEAIRTRRCYAAQACRVIASLSVNGCGMGGTLEARSPGQPRKIEIEVLSGVAIGKLVLVRNGQPLRQWESPGCVARVVHEDRDPYGGPTDYYYLRVERTDGLRAWVSPVWVRYERPVESPESRVLRALATAEDLARGKPVATSFAKPTHGRPALLTDGKLNDHLGHGRPGRAWAQVDLGQVHEIAVIRLWHYYRGGRRYTGNRLAVSPSGAFQGEETVIFDSGLAGEYAETSQGRLFFFEPVHARYIRNWLEDNTSGTGSQWVELEAYGPLK